MEHYDSRKEKGSEKLRIDVSITSRDRWTELINLLQSLRFQTFQDFDILIVDGSQTPIQYCEPFNKIVTLLRFEGHKVIVERAKVLNENCAARNQCYALGDNPFILRMDDDTFFNKPSDLQNLHDAMIQYNADGVGAVTPTLGNPELVRSNKFVHPIINKVEFDSEGNVSLSDDCGYTYVNYEVIPAQHLRSSFIFKREIWEKIKFDVPGTVAFREESVWCLNAAWAGYKRLFVHTGVKFLHLQTSSGGCRLAPEEYQKFVWLDDEAFKIRMKRKYKKLGDPFGK